MNYYIDTHACQTKKIFWLPPCMHTHRTYIYISNKHARVNHHERDTVLAAEAERGANLIGGDAFLDLHYIWVHVSVGKKNACAY